MSCPGRVRTFRKKTLFVRATFFIITKILLNSSDMRMNKKKKNGSKVSKTLYRRPYVEERRNKGEIKKL